jgi:predicted ATPase
MLTKITLENFKAFQKLNNLKIKPITILCGTNSCGKSSILQSILLLKQTLESKNSKQNLVLNGDYVKLPYFKDVIYKKNLANPISFDFTFCVKPNLQNIRQNVRPRFLLELINSRNQTNKDTEYIIDYKVSLKSINGHNYDENEYQNFLDVTHLSVKISTKPENEPNTEILITINHIENDLYDISWQNLNNHFGLTRKKEEPKNGNLKMRIQFENLLPFALSPENIDEQNENYFQNVRFTLYRIKDLLQYFFSLYSYVGPLRKSHNEGGGAYFGDNILNIGNNGENAPFLYLKEKKKELNNHYFYNKKEDTFVEKLNITLEKAFDEWFQLMGIEGFDGTEIKRIINLFLNANKFDNTPIDISQVGFGVSQMFPIVLEGLRMEKGCTLLLEQPEIHLHPNLQMQIADYLISLALSDKRIIVETHSDHIINRLVRRIIEDDMLHLNDLIGIYFIKQSENGSIFEEINIDDTKGITNWPPDFFDQAANEQMRIMQAGLKKRKNQRNKSKE